MKTLHIFSTIFLLALSIFAMSDAYADKVSVQDGDWHDPNTWSNSSIPNSDEQITIEHNIVTKKDITHTGSLIINGGGHLIINDGAVFSIRMGGSIIAECEFKNTCKISGDRENRGSLLFAGKTLSFNYLSVEGLGGGYTNISGYNYGLPAVTIGRRFNENDTDFVAAGNDNESTTISIRNSRFLDSGHLEFLTIPPGIVDLSYNLFEDITNQYALIAANFSSANISIRCTYFSKKARIMPTDGIEMSENIFTDALEVNNGKFKLFSDNLVLFAKDTPLGFASSMSNNYLLNINPEAKNPHFIDIFAAASGKIRLDNNIFQNSNSDDDGDCILIQKGKSSDPADKLEVTILNNVVLPNNIFTTNNIERTSSCTLFTAFGEKGQGDLPYYIYADHNSYVTSTKSGEGSGAVIGETYKGHVDMLKTFRSNLAVGLSTNNGFILGSYSAFTPVSNIVYAKNVSHNGYFNISKVIYPQVYVDNSDNLGLDDVKDEDPLLLDPYRSLVSWAVSKGGDKSIPSALSLIRQDLPFYGGKSESITFEIIDYIRAGFYPLNNAYHNRAHSGRHIGAVSNKAGMKELNVDVIPRLFGEEDSSPNYPGTLQKPVNQDKGENLTNFLKSDPSAPTEKTGGASTPDTILPSSPKILSREDRMHILEQLKCSEIKNRIIKRALSRRNSKIKVYTVVARMTQFNIERHKLTSRIISRCIYDIDPKQFNIKKRRIITANSSRNRKMITKCRNIRACMNSLKKV